MKEALYSLEDREYSLLIQRIGEVLTEFNPKYAIVGGTAAQLHTVGLICKKEKKPLEDLILLEQISERKNLRRTNDIDLIVNEPVDPIKIVESLEGEVETRNDIFEIKLKRKGKKRPIYNVKSLNGEATIMVNISHDDNDLERLPKEKYGRFLKGFKEVEFDYEDLHPKVNVIKPEHLIATKLARNSPKDQFDIWTLVDTFLKYKRSIKIDEIKEIFLEDKIIIAPDDIREVMDIDFEKRFRLFKADYEQRIKESVKK